MKCSRCGCEVDKEQEKCSVCGTPRPVIHVREDYAAHVECVHPPKSRAVAILVTFLGCGLFLWAYLGDRRKQNERIQEFKDKLIGAIFLIGLPSYLGMGLRWLAVDLYEIITKNCYYSDGSKVWR